MARRIGLAFCEQPNDVPTVARAAKKAEAIGVDSVWFAEDLWTRRDGFVYLTAAALATKSIRIGTAVATAYTRHPMQLAMTFNTLSDVAAGRLILGIGAGMPWQPILGDAMARRSPLGAVKEQVTQFRELASGGTVTYSGRQYSLAVDRACYTAIPPRLGPIPIYIGARGPLMTDLAGQIGEGLMIGTGVPVEEVRAGIGRAMGARRDAGRSSDPFDVAAIIVVSVHAKGRIDPNVLCKVAGEVAGLGDAQAGDLGLDVDRCRRVRDLLALGDCRRAFGALDRAMIDTFVAAGTVEDCMHILAKYVDAGVTLPILMPFGRGLPAILDLAREYMASGGGPHA